MNSFSTLPFEYFVSGSVASSAWMPFSGSARQLNVPLPAHGVPHEPWPEPVGVHFTPVDFVAALEDAAVVAEDRVDAGAAGRPVGAPAEDDLVVLRVAEDDVGAAARVDRVVARLAVHFADPADVVVLVAGRREVGAVAGRHDGAARGLRAGGALVRAARAVGRRCRSCRAGSPGRRSCSRAASRRGRRSSRSRCTTW